MISIERCVRLIALTLSIYASSAESEFAVASENFQSRKQKLIEQVLEIGLKQSFRNVEATLNKYFPQPSEVNSECSKLDAEISVFVRRWIAATIQHFKKISHDVYDKHLTVEDLEAIIAGSPAPSLINDPARMEEFARDANSIVQRGNYFLMVYFTDEIHPKVEPLIRKKAACEELRMPEP